MSPIGRIVEAVRDGAIVLTANQRLSRTLRKAYDETQLAARHAAWPSPTILPLSAWLRAQWADAALAPTAPALLLLSTAQEASVWRAIIGETPEGALLVELSGTAALAMDAWRLVHQYRVPVDGRFGAHEDWAAFEAWAGAYRRISDEKGWMDEARLADAVRDAIATRALAPPPCVLLAGFDELTPQQKELLGALEQAGCPSSLLDPDPVESNAVRRSCRDAEDELRSAAEWARGLLRTGAKRNIGIVLLNLGARRTRLERIFDATFHPERMRDASAAGDWAYHISIPDSLGDYPLVSAALTLLRMAPAHRWTLSDAGRLLRSPYTSGGVEEAPLRAALDVKLRRRRRTYVIVHSVTRLATGCESFLAIVERWRALHAALADVRLPSEWGAMFRSLLEAAGWPGDRVLSSFEYQVFEAWRGVLGELAALDPVTGASTYEEALRRLAELARDTRFQPQDPGAPVQIMGALEAAGARFDALWISGATDQAWPAPSHPHPFLPLSLQKERRMPHSTPEREFEFATRIFERLRASSPELVVSWAERAGDVELRPSPLIVGLPGAVVVKVDAPLREPVPMEQIVDETAPPLDTNRPRGGTNVLKLASACPFRAFANLRLGAQPLEAGELGLSAADRGSALHDALSLFWTTAGNHATLVAMSVDELRRTAAEAASTALRKPFRDAQHAFEVRFRDLEIRRLTGVLVEWAELEMTRSPFRVAAAERERTIRVGGLELEARIDRVDELPDGRQVILDYKATAPSVSAWSGERPDEPQLPLYAISNDRPVAAVAFAQVGPDGLRFRGYAADRRTLPGVQPFEDTAEQQIAEWRRVLEPIAAAFRRGDAAADPKHGAKTCELCRLTALCRIHETMPTDSGHHDAEDPDATS